MLGAFSNDVISGMDNEIIEKIKRMGNYSSEGKIKSFDLKDLLLKCEMVILASNSNHIPVSYTHLRAHETVLDLVCRLLLEKKK